MKKAEKPTATMGIRQITSAAEFNDWAARVNEAYSNEYLHELQDIFARSDYSLLKELFNDTTPYPSRSTHQWRLLIFAIMKCMGEEQAYHFILQYSNRLLDKLEAELRDKLENAAYDYEWRKAEFDKKDRMRQAEIVQLKYVITRMEDENTECNKRINGLEEYIKHLELQLDPLERMKSVLRDMLNL